ncbi:hypothetical protein PsYK624_075600 [Phanerochaete sordida]|uniref:Uncharacterized protein n=1 Tax=Phanerochaete sordida TaxID=48140 RepID=A0A9P3GCL9_9APHY|nr:hypothetical protein PsYK624_075600 [Phanerochaete sordida]
MPARFTAAFLESQSYKELQRVVKELKASNPDDESIQGLSGRMARKAMIETLLALTASTSESSGSEGDSALSCEDDAEPADAMNVDSPRTSPDENQSGKLAGDVVTADSHLLVPDGAGDITVDIHSQAVPATDPSWVDASSKSPVRHGSPQRTTRSSPAKSPKKSPHHDPEGTKAGPSSSSSKPDIDNVLADSEPTPQDGELSVEQQLINRWMRGSSAVRVVPKSSAPESTAAALETMPSTAKVSTQSASRSPTPTPGARSPSPRRWTRPADSDSDYEMAFKGFGNDRKPRTRGVRRAASPLLNLADPPISSGRARRPPKASPRKRFSSLSADESDDDNAPRSSEVQEAWLQKASQPPVPEDAEYSQGLDSSQQESQEEEDITCRKPYTLARPEVDDDDDGDDVKMGAASARATPRPDSPKAGPRAASPPRNAPSGAQHETNPKFPFATDDIQQGIVFDFATQYMQTLLKWGKVMRPAQKDALLDALMKAWDKSIGACNLAMQEQLFEQQYPVPDEATLPDVRRMYFRWELPLKREEDWLKRRMRVFPFIEDEKHLGSFNLPDWAPAYFVDGQYHERPPPPRGPRWHRTGHPPVYDTEDEEDPMVLKPYDWVPRKKKQVGGDTPAATESVTARPDAPVAVAGTSTASVPGPSRLPTIPGPSEPVLGKRARDEDSDSDDGEEDTRPAKRVEGLWMSRR